MSKQKVKKSAKKAQSLGFLQKLFNVFRLNIDKAGKEGTLESDGPVAKTPIKSRTGKIEQLNTKAANSAVMQVDTHAPYVPLHELILTLIQQNLNKNRYKGGLISSVLPADEANFFITQELEIKYGLKKRKELTQDPDMEPPENNDAQPSNRKNKLPRMR